MVERRQGADDAADDRHGMRVAPEAVVELAQLLVDHGVQHDTAFELGQLFPVGQLAVQQQVSHFQERGLLRELVDRIAAMQQDAFVAVDIGDAALASRGAAVAGIVREEIKVGVQLANVEHRRADRSGEQGQGG